MAGHPGWCTASLRMCKRVLSYTYNDVSLFIMIIVSEGSVFIYWLGSQTFAYAISRLYPLALSLNEKYLAKVYDCI